MSEPEVADTPAPEEPTPPPPYEPMRALRVWHAALEDPSVPGGIRYADEPDAYGRTRNVDLRMKLVREEFKEVMDELLDFRKGTGDRAKLAKELADLLYVTYGTADDFGIPLQDVFNAVHSSNMTKIPVNGKVIRRNDGKVIKGAFYVPPDIEGLLSDSV